MREDPDDEVALVVTVFPPRRRQPRKPGIVTEAFMKALGPEGLAKIRAMAERDKKRRR